MAVGVMLPGRLTKDPQEVGANTPEKPTSGRGPGRFAGDWNELPNLFNQNKNSGVEFIEKFKQQAENPDSRQYPSDNVYKAIRITYKDTPQVAITTTNNVIIKVSVGKRAAASNISIDQLPKKLKETDAYDQLKESIKNLGYDYTEAKNGDLTVKPKYSVPGNVNIDGILGEFWTIVNTVEEMGESFDAGDTSRTSGSTDREMTSLRYYLGAANIIYLKYKHGMSHLKSRGGKNESSRGTFDINDALITKAFSKKGYELLKTAREYRLAGEPIPENGRPYREHAVPSNKIMEIGEEMFKQRKTKAEVADMIRRNLFIVWISPDEAYKMDIEMKMRSTMPPDWEDGDSPWARLSAAGIKVYRLTDGTRLSEDEVVH
jgi:hypothetical protein